MAQNDNERLEHVRRAYERGRLRRALPAALWALPMLLVSLLGGTHWDLKVMATGGLMILLVGLIWRGGAAGRAVGPGLVAGLAPLALPLLMRSLHVCGMTGCAMLCMPACVVGGVVGGMIVAIAARRVDRGRLTFVLAAGLVTALVGALGCMVAGVAGVLVMLAAVAVLPVPVLVLRAPR